MGLKRKLSLESLENRIVLSGTTIRPIDEFVDAQGTFDAGTVFVPPVANFIGWGNNPPDKAGAVDDALVVSVDYAGLVDRYLESEGETPLGTEFSGRISERELDDGRAELKVVLHTTRALTWVTDPTQSDGNPFAPDNPTVFGNRIPEVLEGEPAALGDSTLKVTIINSEPGAPVPDLLQVLFGAGTEGQEITRLSFQATATGVFTEAGEQFLGYEAGSAGRVTISQVGLLDNVAVSDPFPVENVKLHAVGAGITASASAGPASSNAPPESAWSQAVDEVFADPNDGRAPATKHVAEARKDFDVPAETKHEDLLDFLGQQGV